jgi:hypothetical protein
MSQMDFTDTITEFAYPGGLDIVRATGSYDKHGNWVNKPTTLHADLVSIQPAELRQLETLTLMEGERVDHALYLVSNLELKHSSVKDKGRGDRFQFDGDTYEIRSHGPWHMMAGYFDALAIKVQQ